MTTVNNFSYSQYFYDPATLSEPLYKRVLLGAAAPVVGLLALTGCVHEATRDDIMQKPGLPAWVKNPPKNQYVGVSSCESVQQFAEMSAFHDAWQQKCAPDSGNYSTQFNGYPRAYQSFWLNYDSCMVVLNLYRGNDVDCGTLKSK